MDAEASLRAVVRYLSWRNIALGATVLGYVALVLILVLWVAAKAVETA